MRAAVAGGAPVSSGSGGLLYTKGTGSCVKARADPVGNGTPVCGTGGVFSVPASVGWEGEGNPSLPPASRPWLPLGTHVSVPVGGVGSRCSCWHLAWQE